MRQTSEVYPNIPHFLRVRGPRILRSRTPFVASPEEMGDDFRTFSHIFAYAWLDSGYMIMRQFLVSRGLFTHFLREGGPRILIFTPEHLATLRGLRVWQPLFGVFDA